MVWIVWGCAQPVEPAPPPPAAGGPCLESLGGEPRAEVWTRAGVELADGGEVGFDWAPQGGLYTPYAVRVWGRPELYRPSEYPDLGRVWARWSVVDPADGYVLADHAEGSSLISCVPDGADAFLEFTFDVEYFGEDGGGMEPDALEGRQVELEIGLGPHPAAGGG
ncbi:MAG: hypothetical protein ABMA64_29845, partial [Myxococcota bacterium]